MLRKIKPNFWFLFVWIAVCFGTGQYKYFNAEPQGMHQGAQTDRACVAWNYYHESMNFFEPRVSENRAHEGVGGMEFPIVNYTAAVGYKIFGQHDAIYRSIMFLLVTMGVFSAWLITSFFIQKTLSRLIVVFTWYLSPIMLFYGNSFLPDPAAMALSMMALYQFVKWYFQLNIQKSMWWYIGLMSLAGLIKITYLIAHFSVIGIWFVTALLPHFFSDNLRTPYLKWYTIILPFIPATAWYAYSNYLTQKTGNILFLQKINPATSLHDFIDNSKFSWNTWADSVYFKSFIIGLLILYVFTLVYHRKKSPLPAALSLFLVLGFIAVFLFFNFQFRYHDYYYFILFPALFFIILFVQQVHLEGNKVFFGIVPVILLILFYILPYYQYNHSKSMLKNRYEPGNYFHQNAFPEAQFYNMELRSKIAEIIPDNEEIITAFDNSPNTSLYLLRKRGVRIASDFTPQLTADIIHAKKINYLVINDSLRWQNQYDTAMHFSKKMLYKKGVISVWKLNYR